MVRSRLVSQSTAGWRQLLRQGGVITNSRTAFGGWRDLIRVSSRAPVSLPRIAADGCGAGALVDVRLIGLRDADGAERVCLGLELTAPIHEISRGTMAAYLQLNHSSPSSPTR
ncbi:hypothetical protein NDU88_003299 [Pleurodeles waltl]|uniref:Uncharacterized protein n=1 Tax=Pleurodeles waltl TaxID=8319 RepID=A0AAV7KX31_PLEWA|nr:hypothetical protein NDU88_003299 [Pleurodeles waltl]